jgi:hypothetical protein
VHGLHLPEGEILKILILDMTHGGDILALEYVERGEDVTCVDCYKTLSAEICQQLTESGVRCLETAPSERFDLLVSPIHCSDSLLGEAEFDRRMTFHQAVGELTTMRKMTIEVTGARGKTSTCHVLSHMLNHFSRSIIQVTSRGIHHYKGDVKTVEERASIAPSTVLQISKMETPFDTGVFEVSLGGTGMGDVSIITTLGENYPIAGGTRTAFDGKKQMINLAQKVVVIPEEERELWSPHIAPGIWITTFGEGGNVDAQLDAPLEIGEEVEIKFKCHPVGEFSTTIKGDFLVPIYLKPMAAALIGLKSCGIAMPLLCESLNDFRGVPGRGEIYRENETWIVRDRNPGVSAHSVEYELSILEDYYNATDIGLVIEPVSRKVCEKLSLQDMDTIFEVHDSVTGAYLLNPQGAESEVKNFTTIDDISDIRGRHPIILWCTKEGYI